MKKVINTEDRSETDVKKEPEKYQLERDPAVMSLLSKKEAEENRDRKVPKPNSAWTPF